MISIEVALIMTGGMIGGPIIFLLISNNSWFKKEKFKFNQQIDRKEMSIRFKKMEKDLHLKESAPIPPREKGLLEALQGLDPAIINRFLGPVQKGEDEEYEDIEPEEKTDLVSTLLKIKEDYPDLADKFIKNIGGGGSNEKESTYL